MQRIEWTGSFKPDGIEMHRLVSAFFELPNNQYQAKAWKDGHVAVIDYAADRSWVWIIDVGLDETGMTVTALENNPPVRALITGFVNYVSKSFKSKVVG